MQATSEKEQVFIPGKNWRLSLAELSSFLEARKIDFVVREFSREFFEVNVDADSDDVKIGGFGGFLKIGVVKATLETELLKRFFVEKNKAAKSQIEASIASSKTADKLLSNAGSKQLFGVSVYCAARSLRRLSSRIQRFVGSSIKKGLSAQSVKADFMGFSGDRKWPQLTHVEVLKKQLVQNSTEVLFCIGRKQTRIAVTTAVHNPFEFQERDVGKPVERKIFAMPPRLARIMVNLSGCTPGKTFLDPFCGVGTVLQEALLSGVRVLGVDLNPWCVKAARKNLEWLTREYDLKETDFTVLQGDARKLSSRVREVDCIATEPDLGPALRHAATKAYASKIVAKLEQLYFDFLEDAFNVLNVGGRLVMVTPYFQTRSGEPVATCFAEMAEEVGFKRVFPFKKEFFERDDEAERKLMQLISLVDVSERHKVGREIHVFQR